MIKTLVSTLRIIDKILILKKAFFIGFWVPFWAFISIE